jgi:CRISPR system Cascade subunit CasE
MLLRHWEEMMYFSRVEIDIKNRQKTKDLNSLEAYHNWVERLFPDEIKQRERSRKLWRIDKLGEKEYLLVVSERIPDLKAMSLYGIENTAESKCYDTFLQRLEKGHVLRFKVTLNPVVSRSTGKLSGKRGRVFPHITVDQKMKYLKDRAVKNGFLLEDDDFYISDSRYDILKRKGNRAIKVSRVSYEGKLVIDDALLFRKLLANGLGKKKAYGCGLMTVIPY